MAFAAKYLHTNQHLELADKVRGKYDICEVWFFFFYRVSEKA